MKAFSFSYLIDLADVHLSDQENMWFNDPSKRITYSCEPESFFKKMESAKMIVMAHNEYNVWKPRLFFISQEIHPRAFIFATTDISFSEEDIQDLLEIFPTTLFFLTNYVGNHPRCFVLPLGNKTYDESYANRKNKENTLCITYCRPNSQDRLEFYDFLQKNPIFQSLCLPELNERDYNCILSETFFSVCCCGNGYDTYRFWESLCNKSIPIVKTNLYFKTLKHQYPKLPFVGIEEWKDLFTLLPKLTPEFYKNIWSTADTSVAFEDYWQVKLSELLDIP